MNPNFVCHNGQNVPWTYVCDGYSQCIDDSDEKNCHCQGDVYACLQGNNVSCRVACATYGRVTCLTYQNSRACEQYTYEQSSLPHIDISSTRESFMLTKDFDALQYSACLAVGILFVVSLVSMILYFIRKSPSKRLSSYINKSFSRQLNQTSTERLSPMLQPHCLSSNLHTLNKRSSSDLPPSYYCFDQISLSMNDFYEPPPYPGPSTIYNTESIATFNHSETATTQRTSNSMSQLHSMLLPEVELPRESRTYIVCEV